MTTLERMEELAAILRQVEAADHDYDRRYALVVEALAVAVELGIHAGFGIDNNPDPAMDGYRVVVYIELPSVGQVSWHMPEHGTPWDGHDTPEKYRRCREFRRLVDETEEIVLREGVL